MAKRTTTHANFQAAVTLLGELGYATTPASFTDSANPALRFELALAALPEAPSLTAVIAPVNETTISILVPNLGTDLGDDDGSERLRAWALNVNYSGIYVRVGIDARDGEIRFVGVLPSAGLTAELLATVIAEFGEVAFEYLTLVALRRPGAAAPEAPIRFE